MANQPISFSLLRLSKPELLVETPLKLNLEEDIRLDEKLKLEDEEHSELVGEEGFSHRVHLESPSDLSGLNGWIQLPQDIGEVYLGEQFCCYISAWNNTEHPILSLGISVDMTTARSRTLLFENREAPIECLEPDQRKEFAIRYDVKDVGTHALKCLVIFVTASKERISLSLQLLKFNAKTPVLIRTKVRSLGSRSCLLEASLESLKEDEPLILEYVRFDPVQRFLCTPVLINQEFVKDGPLKDYINSKATKVMARAHSSRNFLFRLDPVEGRPEEGASESRSLGKLEIKWRSRLGGEGRLQTQQIQGLQTASEPREITGKIVSVQPQTVVLYQPFEVVVRLNNQTDDTPGPFLLTSRGEVQDEDGKVDSAVKVSGKEEIEIKALEQGVSTDVSLWMVALKSGVHSIQGLTILDKVQKTVLGVVDSRQLFISK